MREPIDGKGIANAESAGDVALVAAVVFGGGTNVPAINTMRCHVWALVGSFVDNDTSTGRGKRAAVKIEGAIEAGIGREFWLAAR